MTGYDRLRPASQNKGPQPHHPPSPEAQSRPRRRPDGPGLQRLTRLNRMTVPAGLVSAERCFFSRSEFDTVSFRGILY